MQNADPRELEKFSELAHRWWDPLAEFRPLHEINPLRLAYIDAKAGLRGSRVLDVGAAADTRRGNGCTGRAGDRHRSRRETLWPWRACT
jgi:hypothetical protein